MHGSPATRAEREGRGVVAHGSGTAARGAEGVGRRLDSRWESGPPALQAGGGVAGATMGVGSSRGRRNWGQQKARALARGGRELPEGLEEPGGAVRLEGRRWELSRGAAHQEARRAGDSRRRGRRNDGRADFFDLRGPGARGSSGSGRVR
jgi:hypothetical protein